MNLYCYCCGEPIANTIVLVTMKEPTDRVFVAKPDHVENFDDVKTLMVVPI